MKVKQVIDALTLTRMQAMEWKTEGVGFILVQVLNVTKLELAIKTVDNATFGMGFKLEFTIPKDCEIELVRKKHSQISFKTT